MILKIFSIYDVKSKAFSVPIFTAHEAIATRAFAAAANEPSNQIAQAPEDFTLYEIGQFNDASAAISSYPQPVHICIAAQLVREKGNGKDAPEPVGNAALVLSGSEGRDTA